MYNEGMDEVRADTSERVWLEEGKEIREEESVSNQVFFTVIVLKPRYLPTIEAWIAKMPDNNDIIH